MSTRLDSWNIGKSEDLYAIQQWGKGYFSINGKGNVCVHPSKMPDLGIDLKALVDQIGGLDIHPPVLLRFPQILKHRLAELHDAFASAIKEFAYKAPYRCVYPIKVNQQRHVVEEIYHFGKEYGFGLEAGSKPELLAVLALVDTRSTPIVCNGFKDAEYIETVVLAQKLGKTIIPVIEGFNELSLLIDKAAAHGIRPVLGVRVKLASRGTGRWEASAGDGAKFGLTSSELLRALEFLTTHGIADQLKLLHFHIGSQITNIRNIKDAINEAARIYVELRQAGAGLEYLDVGGGLGIDYDGSQTNFGSSMNYTLGEYARDVVHGVQSVCDQAKAPHPTIISESGRAVAAYYSVLVFNVLGVAGVGGNEPPPPRPTDDLPPPIRNLYDALRDLTGKNVLEAYHDALQARDDALNLFNLGYLTLKQRSVAEQLFWYLCREIQKICRRMPYIHEDLQALESTLADTYLCNYSVFQSMPDSWAIHQLFPIMPIHRLDERPDRMGTIADMTCDSDGKIDRFIDLRDVKPALELHAYQGSDYYLAAFLVGAYQEILGDLHNLFGDTHAVHVALSADGKPVIENIVKGDTVRDVLKYVSFSADELTARLRREVYQALQHERLHRVEAEQLLQFYASGMEGYTYLE